MTKMTFIRTSAAALAFTVVSAIGATAWAQTAQVAKVLVVDIGEITRSSLAGKDLSKQIENHSAELQGERDRLQQEARTQEQELSRQQQILSGDAFEKKRNDLAQKFAAAQSDYEDKVRRFQIGARKAERELQSALTPIYQALLNKYGANLILERSTLVMAGSGLDVTREVIDQLDQKISSLKLEIPAPDAAVKDQ